VPRRSRNPSHKRVTVVTVRPVVAGYKKPHCTHRMGGLPLKAVDTSVELRENLEAIANEVFRAKGSALFRRGDEASGVFVVRSGKVKLGLGCDERLYPSRILGVGALVGLPATMSGEPYSLTAEVVEDSRLGFVSRDAMLDLLRNNSKLSFQVMQLLSEEISGMRSTLKEKVLPSKAGR
jgi:CRP-like cAMP-binding protein